MRSLRSMKELLDLSSGSIVKVSLIGREKVFLVTDWRQKRTWLHCLMKSRIAGVPRFLAFPEMGEWRVAVWNGLTFNIHRYYHGKLCEASEAMIQLLEPSELRAMLCRLSEAGNKANVVAELLDF